MEDERKPHQCPFIFCGKSFDRPYKLAQHILLHQNLKIFACPEENCSKQYGSKSHLDRHRNTVHEGKKNGTMFKCLSCNKMYSSRQGLTKHSKKCVDSPTASELFKCGNCNDVFKKKHQLNTHMYEHTGIKAFSGPVDFSCKLCGESFVSLLEKKRHKRSHDKIYTCDECFEQFRHWSKFQRHKKSDHSNNRVFVCDHCKRRFSKRVYIVRHMKTHFELVQQLFPCPYEGCLRQYTKKSNLKVHIRATHEKKFLSCTICQGQFTTKASLGRHHYLIHERGPIRGPPKTKATGRLERSDAGNFKTPLAMRIAGITDILMQKIQEATLSASTSKELNAEQLESKS